MLNFIHSPSTPCSSLNYRMMLIPFPIFASAPVVVSLNGNILLQQLSTPTQTWTSVQLASNIRPGIPVGSNVGPFRLAPKIAQQEKSVDVVENDGFMLIDSTRMVLESEGKADPSKLPGLTAQVVPDGVKLTWQSIPQSRIRGRLKLVLEYEIYRVDLAGNEVGKYVDTLVGKTGSLSFLDKSARKGHRYFYRVLTGSFIPKDADMVGHNAFWDRTPVIEIPK